MHTIVENDEKLRRKLATNQFSYSILKLSQLVFLLGSSYKKEIVRWICSVYFYLAMKSRLIAHMHAYTITYFPLAMRKGLEKFENWFNFLFARKKKLHVVGSPYWMAPEVLRNDQYNETVSYSSMTESMLTGSPRTSKIVFSSRLLYMFF